MPLGNINVVPHYVILTKWSDMSHITIKETNFGGSSVRDRKRLSLNTPVMRRSHCRAISYERHDCPFVADRGISLKN